MHLTKNYSKLTNNTLQSRALAVIRPKSPTQNVRISSKRLKELNAKELRRQSTSRKPLIQMPRISSGAKQRNSIN